MTSLLCRRQSAKADEDTFKADWWELFGKIDEPPGEKAIAEACRRLEHFRANWEQAYPSAIACLLEAFESLIVHLRFPAEHRHLYRHTDLIERTFGETRRRTKVIGQLRGERTCFPSPSPWSTDRAKAGAT